MSIFLLALALKHNGNWEKIYNDIKQKIKPTELELENAKNYKGDYITILDDKFPDKLRNIISPPFVLFYKGNIDLLNKEKIISVIGTRRPSFYGIDSTKKIVSDLVDEGCVICSGLARGIDAESHKEAINSNGPTIAVIGNGIDYCYPSTNKLLYEEIIEFGGLIISEYPGLEQPKKEYFPMRNRIVAGICDGLLIIEAHTHSGTQITAKQALYNGKSLYCVPDRIDKDSITNKFIKEGALLIESGDEIVFDLYNKIKK